MFLPVRSGPSAACDAWLPPSRRAPLATAVSCGEEWRLAKRLCAFARAASAASEAFSLVVIRAPWPAWMVVRRWPSATLDAWPADGRPAAECAACEGAPCLPNWLVAMMELPSLLPVLAGLDLAAGLDGAAEGHLVSVLQVSANG